VKSREISSENLLLSLTVGTKHSQCPVALGSCFVFLSISVGDQWHIMTSLTGGEMRDNCVDKFFLPQVLTHFTQPSFAIPPIYFCSHWS